MARPVESAMTVREVATFLNVDPKTIYRLAQLGELPGFKVAGSWRFQKVDLERWIEEKKRLTTATKRASKREPQVAVSKTSRSIRRQSK